MSGPRRALAALLLAGCGGDPGIVGLYMTVDHEAAADACEGGVTPDGSPPYFRIEKREVLGIEYHTRTNCPDTAPSSCSGGGGLLVDETDDGYRGEAFLAFGDASSCTLAWLTYEASLDGDELTFENLNYAETGAIDPCTTDEAQARAGDMPCVSYELIVGLRVD